MKTLHIKTDSAIHIALQNLSAGGVLTGAKLYDLAHEGVPSLRKINFHGHLLPQAVEYGLMLTHDDGYTITAEGTAALTIIELRKKMAVSSETKSNTVPANLYRKPKTDYDGAELAVVADRPGALDYRAYPSIINGRRQDYHLAPAKYASGTGRITEEQTETINSTLAE